MQACRRKARVVLVGDVGLHLERADLYEKELDFLIRPRTDLGVTTTSTKSKDTTIPCRTSAGPRIGTWTSTYAF